VATKDNRARQTKKTKKHTMKKILYSAMILSLAFVSCDKENEPEDENTFELGIVSFKTQTTWEVGNQIWSDVVMAIGCKKDDFKGGEFYWIDTVINGNSVRQMRFTSFNIDCRQNPGYGDLFSWEAVNAHKNLLCPADWRVPTREDFIALDIEFGGTGSFRHQIPNFEEFINETYMNPIVWGGSYGGGCDPDGPLNSSVGTRAFYWSQTEDNTNSNNAFILRFDSVNRSVDPQNRAAKAFGDALRCVRNK
jgi:uncharacterized protein (TIGR02145 family)